MRILFSLVMAIICAGAFNAQAFSVENQDGNPNAANFVDPDDKNPHFDGNGNSQSGSDGAMTDYNDSNLKFTAGGSSNAQSGFSSTSTNSNNNSSK